MKELAPFGEPQNKGSDLAEEIFADVSRLIRRQPILTVAATGALALSAGVFIGWMMQGSSHSRR
jgi:hypothetical protein